MFIVARLTTARCHRSEKEMAPDEAGSGSQQASSTAEPTAAMHLKHKFSTNYSD